MAKIASNLSKDNGNKGIIDSTIGAVYKYAVSSGAGFLSSNIKKLNPFSYLKEEIS